MFFSRPFQSARSAPALWIFLGAFAVQLFVLVRFSQSVHFLPDSDDMKFYHDWAVRITHGQWTDHQAFYGLPGYAYCLAAIYLLVGKSGLFLTVTCVGILQALMNAGIAVVIYRLSATAFAPVESECANRLSPVRPHAIGLAAALAWIAFTPAQAFSAILMPTVWLVLAYYVCVLFALKTRASSWWRPWLLLGLFCGGGAMLVATILFAVPLLVAAIVLSVDRESPLRVRLPKIALAIVTLIAGIYLGASPAWMHNYFIAREPVMLSAHSGINFWIGNNPTATGYPKMPPGIRATQDGLLKDSITLAEEAEGRKMKRYEVSKFWSERANAYISTHRVAWMRLMWVKFENFWNAYQYDDLSIIKLLRDEGILPPGLRFGFIAALGLAGLIPTVVRFPRSRWIAAAVLLHMVAVLTVFVTERYRMAAVPGLMILGAAGLWQLWVWLLRRAWLPASGYLGVAAVAAWFVSTSRQDLSLWSLDHYKAGIRATEAGDLDRAQRNLETAFAYVQNNADINFALGNLWLAKSDRATGEHEKVALNARAKIFYRRALELNPQHAGTLNNLGVLALEEKRYELAEKFFAASLVTEPEAAKTHYLLARARFEQGKLPEARAALDEALRLRPTQKEFLELRDRLTPPPAAPAPPAP
jgi:tetratricopeptide (TPR) repeat protein